jgi:hypothetical protein
MSKGFGQNLAFFFAFFLATVSTAFSQKPEFIDIPSLLQEVKQKSDENWRRMIESYSSYTFKRRETWREAKKEGKIDEKTELTEIFFPSKCRVRKCRPVEIILEKDGKQTAVEKIEKERIKAGEKLEKLENDEQAQIPLMKRDSPTHWMMFYYALHRPFDSKPKLLIKIDGKEILEKCEFYLPERERINGREAISLKFRPRPDAAFSKETNYSQMVEGKIWIDASDKVSFRLLMWQKGTKLEKETSDYLLENAPLAYDLTRVKEGIWFFRLGRITALKNSFISPEMKRDLVIENFDYHYFQTEIKNVEVGSPKQN